jgi:uncharacterized protein involved in type VI secretion and phage assembly
MSDISLFNLSINDFGGKPAVLSFNLLEGTYGDDSLSISFLASSGNLSKPIGKAVSFSFEFEGKKEFFNGIITKYSAEQAETGILRVTVIVKTLRHLLDKEKKYAVFCESDVETIIRSIMSKAGISNVKYNLNSFYDIDFKVQYNESDLEFLQRLLEDYKIIEFAKHYNDRSELVISDSSNFQETELNLAKCRLEMRENGNFFFGCGHSPLRSGQAFTAFGETFIVCSAYHSGSQEAAFGIKDKSDGYTCQIAAFSKQMLCSLPHSKVKPQMPGVIVAKTEGFSGSYAALDSQGRYTIRMPFDDENHNGTLASYPIYLAQNFAGKDFGVHFPLQKDTPILLAFEDGDIDKPIALGALPRETCKSPVASKNSQQNIIKTASGIKICLDDLTKNIEIEAPMDISIKAGGRLILQGNMVEIN